jgi:hypothetical protein
VAQLSDINGPRKVMVESSTQTEPDHLQARRSQAIDVPMDSASSKVWHSSCNVLISLPRLTTGYSVRSGALPTVGTV